MKGENIRDRTKGFAISVIKLESGLPKNYSSQIIYRQIVRSATSSAANYRAACRSKSRRDFVNKLKIVEEELDETNFWLELFQAFTIFPAEVILSLIRENNELLSIIVRSIQTTKENGRKKE